MNFLNKIKKIIPKPFRKEKKEEDVNYIDLCNLVLKLIANERAHKKNKPKSLSNSEWNLILCDIEFAFQSFKRNAEPISPARKALKEKRLNHAIECFKVYIKHL